MTPKAALRPSSKPDLAVDFVIVTALPEEQEAILKKLPGHRKLPPTLEDIHIYYQAYLPVTFTEESSGIYQVIVMCLSGMGRVEASAAVTNTIQHWHPRYIMLVGIAGGTAGQKINLGDILICDQVVDYELQKVTNRDDPKVRWNVYRVDSRLLNACLNFRDESWHKTIEVNRPESGILNRHMGSIASGDKVIAIGKILQKYRKVWPKLIGVEMEASGAAHAALQSPEKPGFFMVRAVSDLANRRKGSMGVEKWRAYACDVAAAFTIAFLRSGPVPPQSLSGESEVVPTPPSDSINPAPNRPPQTASNYEKKAFVSYAWESKSEQVVNELEQLFRERSIHIVRDKKDLSYKGSIETFERRIGQGQCIILVISNKYLRSKHCMYELVEIDKNQELHERIFPIVLPDAQIYTPVNRIGYITFWDEQIEQLNQAIKQVKDVTGLAGFIGDLEKFKRIRDNFDHLTSLLSDMNALTPEIHANSGYSTLIDAVERALNGHQITFQSEETLPQTKKPFTDGNEKSTEVSTFAPQDLPESPWSSNSEKTNKESMITKWWKKRGYDLSPFQWENALEIPEDHLDDFYVDPLSERPLENGNFHLLEKIESQGRKQLLIIYASSGSGKTFYSIFASKQLEEPELDQYAIHICNLVDDVDDPVNITADDIAYIVYKKVCLRFGIQPEQDLGWKTGKWMGKCADVCRATFKSKVKDPLVYIFIDDVDTLFEERSGHETQNDSAINALIDFCRVAARRAGNDPFTFRIFIPTQFREKIEQELAPRYINNIGSIHDFSWSRKTCMAVIEKRLEKSYKKISDKTPNRLLALLADETMNEINVWLDKRASVSPRCVIHLFDQFTQFAFKKVPGKELIPLVVWQQFCDLPESQFLCDSNVPFPLSIPPVVS